MAEGRGVDVAVVGGGQAGLAVGWYLRRTPLSYVMLDEQRGPGGAWRRAWPSLRLFSPGRYGSLPGWLFPATEEEYPSRDETVAYLSAYERRYDLPVRRPVRVEAARRAGDGFALETSEGRWTARALVAATGTWARPFVPHVPGREAFRGVQLHSAAYEGPDAFAGRRVLVVGGGNSGAQIVAELAPVAAVTWVTREPPRFLPDDVDGRALFDRATALYRAREAGLPEPPPANLGDIVMIPSVRAARDRGDLTSVRPFTRFTETGVVWPDGSVESVDAVLWCTGFRPALDFLRPLDVLEPDGRVLVAGTRALREPRLWLVGYGNWTGFASATIIGVGRSARATAGEIAEALTGA